MKNLRYGRLQCTEIQLRLTKKLFPKPPWGEGLLHRVASLSASKPAGGGLDAQAAEATTSGVNAIAEVPDAGAACGATAEGLGAPPVELSHGSRSPAQAAGLASRCALIISSKVSGLAPSHRPASTVPPAPRRQRLSHRVCYARPGGRIYIGSCP